MRKNRKDTLVNAVALLFFTVVFLFLSYSRVGDDFERNTFDLRYKLRPERKVSQDIVIVEVGDDSIAKIGHWPFPRNYHALLVTALDRSGARDIIFDIFFSESTTEDESFFSAVRDSGKVYIPYIFDINRTPTDKTSLHALGYAAGTLAELESAARGAGFANVIPDADGKVRRIPLFIEYNGERYPLVSFKAALDRKGVSFQDVKINPGRNIGLSGKEILPIDENSYFFVNYPGRWGNSFRHLSYVDIIQSYLADITGQDATIDLSSLKDTVCFIGVTASASPDAYPSPIENMYPGVGVHASVYDSVMRGNYIKRLGRVPNMIILAFFWLLTAFFTLKLKKRFAGIAMALILAVYLALSFFVFFYAGIWVDMFYPLVSILAVYFIATFKKYIEETQKREMMEKELNIAKDIQESFLPKNLPDIECLDISVKMLTAKQVGGDLYDIIDLGGGKVGVMMGDVSGKGVPAALYMAKATSVFKTYVLSKGPAESVKKTNDRLALESSSGLFVTLSYAVFDTGSCKVDFAIGGHLPTIMISPSGEVEVLDVEFGLPLGLMEGDFSQGSREYAPGSVFVFYTDGVTEAMNVKGEMFSLERLIKLCRALSGISTRDVVNTIHHEVTVFAGKAEQHDDITVMAVRVG